MRYEELENLLSKHNNLVNRINSIIDNEIANKEIEGAPYNEFDIMQANDENEGHAPYLYLRFVYLPYDNGSNKVDQESE